LDWARRNAFGSICYRGSFEEYLAYTEETEKLEVMQLASQLDGNVEQAIKGLPLRKEKENN
jgi:hypothetical protein